MRISRHANPWTRNERIVDGIGAFGRNQEFDIKLEATAAAAWLRAAVKYRGTPFGARMPLDCDQPGPSVLGIRSKIPL